MDQTTEEIPTRLDGAPVSPLVPAETQSVVRAIASDDCSRASIPGGYQDRVRGWRHSVKLVARKAGAVEHMFQLSARVRVSPRRLDQHNQRKCRPHGSTPRVLLTHNFH